MAIKYNYNTIVAGMGCHTMLWLAAAATLCAGALGDDTFTELHLHNLNETLDASSLKYPHLKHFGLYNSRMYFNAETFLHFPELGYLSLKGNYLSGKELPSTIFRNNVKLFAIDIKDNDMRDTPVDLLQGLNQIMYLSLNNCSLRTVPPFIANITFDNISAIILDSNNISKLDDPKTFHNVPYVTHISLSNNQIEYLHVDLLKPLISIRELFLDGNRIRRIPEVFFQNKSALFSIDLSRNLIEDLPAKAFLGSNLSYFRVRDNRLIYLPSNWFSELQRYGVSLDTFYFEGNPWSCACLNDVLVKVKELKIRYTADIYNGNEPVCIITGSFQCHRPDLYQKLYNNLIKDLAHRQT